MCIIKIHLYLCINESTSRTASGPRAASLVMGQTPPFANVEPITANVSQLTSIAHV